MGILSMLDFIPTVNVGMHTVLPGLRSGMQVLETDLLIKARLGGTDYTYFLNNYIMHRLKDLIQQYLLYFRTRHHSSMIKNDPRVISILKHDIINMYKKSGNPFQVHKFSFDLLNVSVNRMARLDLTKRQRVINLHLKGYKVSDIYEKLTNDDI